MSDVRVVSAERWGRWTFLLPRDGVITIQGTPWVLLRDGDGRWGLFHATRCGDCAKLHLEEMEGHGRLLSAAGWAVLLERAFHVVYFFGCCWLAAQHALADRELN